MLAANSNIKIKSDAMSTQKLNKKTRRKKEKKKKGEKIEEKKKIREREREREREGERHQLDASDGCKGKGKEGQFTS